MYGRVLYWHNFFFFLFHLALKSRCFRLMPKLAHERQRAANPNYTLDVLSGIPKRICLTCHHVKAFRDHHCSECGVCVYRVSQLL